MKNTELAFSIFTPDGSIYRIYSNGEIEGFPAHSVVFNRIPALQNEAVNEYCGWRLTTMPELDSYFGTQVFTEQELADIRLRSFAGRITNDAVLWQVVRDAKPELREQVYDEIKPHLKFEPLEYSKLAATHEKEIA